jgi:hypothetical protein
MRQLCNSLRLILACALVACFAFGARSNEAFGQGTAQSPQYVIPEFNGNPGSELILANLSGNSVSAEVTLIDSTTLQAVNSAVTVQAGTEQHLTAGSFGLSAFNGSVLLNTSAPLSVLATLADTLGGFETIRPASSSGTVVVPFVPGAGGSMNVTIFNPQASTTTVLISIVAPDGSTIATVQIPVPAMAAITQNVSALVPIATFGSNRDVLHAVVRTLSNVLSTSRSVYVQAVLTNFSADAEGIPGPHFDPALINGVPLSSGVTTATVPFFVEGGDYQTMIQVINTSSAAISATLTATGPDGSIIPGTDPATLQIPANGSIHLNVQNIFNFTSLNVQTGSIRIDSSSPVITTTALASVAQNGIVLMPTADAPSTTLAFRVRKADPLFYTGLAFRNLNATPANLTLLNIPDDGSGVSSSLVTIPPFALLSQTLLNFLPEALNPGFMYISSDAPIVAQGIEGRGDNGVLANLPPIQPQPDYAPPVSTKFLITGKVAQNGAALSGASVQLSGSQNATAVTDQTGNYQFTNIPPGQYSVQAGKAGYTFSPASISVGISGASSRGNDFAGTLIPPTITAVLPQSVLAGSSATVLIVAGSPIIATSQIVFDGSPVITSVTSAGIPVTVVGATGGVSIVLQQQTVLTATISADLLATPRVTTVAMENSGPGGSVISNSLTFAVGSPAPTISALAGVPTPLFVGNPGFILTVTGTGFTPGTVVVFQGTPLATTFISGTQLQAFVPPQLLADGGVLNVTTLNPAPTIGPSNALTVTLISPVPGLTAVIPSIAEARVSETALPLPITVQGFGFVPSSLIQIDGAAILTVYHSSTELAGSIPQPLAQTARSAIISVKNPDPVQVVGHFDSVLPFVLYNPVPSVSSLDSSLLLFDPTPRFVGDVPTFPAQVVIHGANFAVSGLVFIYSTPCPLLAGSFSGSRFSSTVVTGGITVACAGQYSLGIVNPQPGGGVSSILSFTVSTYTAPTPLTVSGLAPASIPAGSGSFTMTISGSNFNAGAVVDFGTAVLFPTSVTPNSITVIVPSYLLFRSDRVPVSVTNPDTTGNSNAILFTIN